MISHAPDRYVVVGVLPGQIPSVVAEAAAFARAFKAELVCAWVDASRYAVPGSTAQSVIATSLDPDLADDVLEEFDLALAAEIARSLADRGVTWSVRALAGGPSRELTRLADELDAAAIVVGTRSAGFRGTMHEFFSGSVAVQLAHHQHRPVVVIPVNPLAPDGDPPWARGTGRP